MTNQEIMTIEGDRGGPLVSVSPVVSPLVSADEALKNWKAYQELCSKILDASDHQTYWERGQSKQLKKKSAWRKLSTFYGLADEIVAQEIQRDSYGWPVFAAFSVRACHPNGRQSIGYHEAHLTERCCPVAFGDTCDNSRQDHRCCPKGCSGRRHWSHPGDIPATAHTRAKNRAISDMIGGGEVSAEEMSTQPDRRVVDDETGEIETCPIHGSPWRQNTGKDGSKWQSHRTQDGKWCNRRDVEKDKPPDRPAPAPSIVDAPPVDAIDRNDAAAIMQLVSDYGIDGSAISGKLADMGVARLFQLPRSRFNELYEWVSAEGQRLQAERAAASPPADSISEDAPF